MKNLLLLIVAAVITFSFSSPAKASFLDDIREQQEVRQEIRSMHILHRPYRRGHFYGNTVRKRHREGRSFFYGR